MAVPRVFSQSRSLLSRGLTASRIAPVAIRSARPAFSQRLFTSSATFSQEVAQTSATGSEASSKATPSASTENHHARSIAIFQVPKRAVKSEIEQFLRGEGIDVTKMQLRLDRFTFQNDRMCFVELASEQQAQDAIQRLQKKKLQGQTLVVKPLTENFIWGRNSKEGRLSSRHFFDEGKKAAEAIKPLLEDRRYMLLVQTPGWQDSKQTNEAAIKVFEKHFEPFGVEARSMLRPMFGDKKPDPRLLCFIDFTTKEGAEKAVEAIHEKTIEGRRTRLLICKLSAWRAHQVGKVDAGLLKQLQEKEIAPKETWEDRFVKGSSPSSRKP